MLGVLVAIRNFTIAVLLAWMGFSVAPDDNEKKDSAIAPSSGAVSFFIG